VQIFLQDNYQPLKEAAVRISGNDELSDELLHYAIDEFLKKPNVEEIVLSGGARWFCIKILMNSWKSSSSRFFYTYRQPTLDLEDAADVVEEDEDLTGFVQRTKAILKTLPWYDRMLFETYVDDNHTVSSLARATGIPRTSVSLTLNRVRKHVKRNL
jgi:hypothetical protein